MPESRNLTEELHIIELLRERFYNRHKISPEILRYDIRFVRDYIDQMSDSLLFDLEKHIWQEKTKEVLVYDFPKNLWQLIKEFYFPSWLKRFFRPVKFVEMKVNIDLNIKYLDIPASLRDKKPVLQIVNIHNEVPKYVREQEPSIEE